MAAELKLDYVAVSFPRDMADMQLARELCVAAGSQAWLVAKIERAEAVKNDEVLSGLIEASDAVMVARGDLAVEIGDAELVAIQKKIIAAARRQNTAVITATQMMESMIKNPMPTRAEGLHRRSDVVGRNGSRALSGGSRYGDGANLRGRRKESHHAPLIASTRFRVLPPR